MKTSSIALETLRVDRPDDDGVHQRHGVTRWRVVALVLGIMLVMLVGIIVSGVASAEAPVPVQTALVTYGGQTTQAASFSAGGWVEPAFPYPVAVSPLVSGRIESLLVVKGQDVSKDKPLAILSKQSYEAELALATREHALAEARLAKLLAGFRREDIEQARAELGAAQAEAGFRAEVARRSAELFDAGAVSREAMERDQAENKTAAARLTISEHELCRRETGYRPQDIDEARAEVERARAAMNVAQLRLNQTDILCPVSGKVFDVMLGQGDAVAAHESVILTIYDPAAMQVRVDVRQTNLDSISEGQSARIRTDARPQQPYKGRVLRLDPRANLARDTVRVIVSIDDADGMLYTDMTAAVEFLAAERKETNTSKDELIVPVAAVMEGDQDQSVYVFREGHAVRVTVELGTKREHVYVVTSGLKSGDRVIVAGLDELEDGARVRRGE